MTQAKLSRTMKKDWTRASPEECDNEALRRIGEARGFLDLSGLGLTALPEAIGQLSRLKAFYCCGNPLSSPTPEIVRKGDRAVLAHLRGQRRGWLTGLMQLLAKRQ